MKIPVTKTTTVFACLVEKHPDWSRTRIRQLLKFRKVSRKGIALVLTTEVLHPGEEFEIDFSRDPLAGKKYTPRFPVLHEDHELLVVEKPPGVLTSGDTSPDHPSFHDRVNHYVEENSNERAHAHLVHRLDREVSGLMVFAKSEAMQKALKHDWTSFTKRYVALVEGHLPHQEGTIDNWLVEREDQKVVSGPEGPDSKRAITHYRVLKRLPEQTLLEVELGTGRKNQIRVHLSEMGNPVVGDRRYGAGARFRRRVRLHSWYFSFTHPFTHKPITVRSEMPEGFLSLPEQDEEY